jgi:uncharacterized LabA/DUF88 family protein
MMDKKRVIFYVDGFNFYYGLKNKSWKKYYWLDVVAFFNSFLKEDQELIEVNYFSARQKDTGKRDRQDLLFSANKNSKGFNLILGRYQTKDLNCNSCGSNIRSFEEKQTDVHIASKMIRDVALDKCDISVLVSADSDLCPPLDIIRELNPQHKLFVYFPPKRSSFDLKSKADSVIDLDRFEARFKKFLLPERITLSNGYVVVRPDKWK